MSGLEVVPSVDLVAPVAPATEGLQAAARPRKFFNSKSPKPGVPSSITVSEAPAGAGLPGFEGLSVEAVSPLVRDTPVSPTVLEKILTQEEIMAGMCAELKDLIQKDRQAPKASEASKTLEQKINDFLQKKGLAKTESIDQLRKILIFILQEIALSPDDLINNLKALNLLLQSPYYSPELYHHADFIDAFRKFSADSNRDRLRKKLYLDHGLTGIELFLDMRLYQSQDKPIDQLEAQKKVGSMIFKAPPEHPLFAMRFLGHGILPDPKWDASPADFRNGDLVRSRKDFNEWLGTKGLGKSAYLLKIQARMQKEKRELRRATSNQIQNYIETSVGMDLERNLGLLRGIQLAIGKLREVYDVRSIGQLCEGSIGLAFLLGKFDAMRELINLFDLRAPQWRHHATTLDWKAIETAFLPSSMDVLSRAISGEVEGRDAGVVATTPDDCPSSVPVDSDGSPGARVSPACVSPGPFFSALVTTAELKQSRRSLVSELAALAGPGSAARGSEGAGFDSGSGSDSDSDSDSGSGSDSGSDSDSGALDPEGLEIGF